MKDFITNIFQTSIKWLLSCLIAIGSAYFAVETWVNSKVQAAENRVMFIRSLDMEHLNKRLDIIENLIRDKK